MINMPGGPEMMVIILVALVVLGPEQLPKAMKTFGHVMAEIRKVSSGFQSEIKNAMDSFTEETEKAAAEADKPHSATMTDASQPSSSDASVSEVVARNDAPAPSSDAAGEPESGSVVTATGSVDGPHDRPAIDPADRAAG